MVIQICFQVKDKKHNEEVLEKLKVLKSTLKGTDKVISCHLPLEVVEKEGFDTTMVQALLDIFGEQYECLVKADTLEMAMKYLNVYRTTAAERADRIFIIGPQDIGNIALELELFSRGKIKFL